MAALAARGMGRDGLASLPDLAKDAHTVIAWRRVAAGHIHVHAELAGLPGSDPHERHVVSLVVGVDLLAILVVDGQIDIVTVLVTYAQEGVDGTCPQSNVEILGCLVFQRAGVHLMGLPKTLAPERVAGAIHLTLHLRPPTPTLPSIIGHTHLARGTCHLAAVDPDTIVAGLRTTIRHSTS